MAKGYGIYKDFNGRNRKSINFGYIIIPSDVYDRDAFVIQCIREKRVTVQVEDGGGIINKCRITNEALKNIKFPKIDGDLGTAVCFFTEPFGNQCIITGTFNKNDEIDEVKEDTFIIRNSTNKGSAMVNVDGDGRVNIDVYGEFEDTGEINININNKSKTAKLNINTKGEINIYCEGNTNIRNVGGDVSIDADKTFSVKSLKQVFNKGEEAMVRGNILYEELVKTNEIINSLKQCLTTFTPSDPQSGTALLTYFNGILATKFTGDFKDIKSTKSFLK